MTRNQGNVVGSSGVRGASSAQSAPGATNLNSSPVGSTSDIPRGFPSHPDHTTRVIDLGLQQSQARPSADVVGDMGRETSTRPQQSEAKENDPPQYFSSVPLTFPAHPLVLLIGVVAIASGMAALGTIPFGFLSHAWQVAAIASATLLLLPAGASLLALKGSGAVDHSATLMTFCGSVLVVSAGWFWLFAGVGASAIGPSSAPLLAVGVALIAVHGVARKVLPLVGVYEAVFNDGLTSKERFTLLGGRSKSDTRHDSHLEVAKDSPIDLTPGSVVAADTEILSGSVTVDERRLSGVSSIRVLDEGEFLFGGSTVLAGQAKGSTLSTGKGSCLALLESIIAKRFSRAAHVERLEESTARRSTLLAIIFCSVAAAISFAERSEDPTASLLASGGILICALFALLRDSLLIHRLQFLTNWSRRGVVIPSLASLDTLAGCSEVTFEFPVVEAHSVAKIDRLEILDDRVSEAELAATLLSLLGRAEGELFKSAAQVCGILASSYEPQRVLDYKEFDGKGMCGVLHGVDFTVGTEEFLVDRGIFIQLEEQSESAEMPLPKYYVAVGLDVVAAFLLSPGSLSSLLSGHALSGWEGGPRAGVYTGNSPVMDRRADHGKEGEAESSTGSSATDVSAPLHPQEKFLLVRAQAPRKTSAQLTHTAQGTSTALMQPTSINATPMYGAPRSNLALEAYPMTDGAIAIHRDALTLLGGEPSQLGRLIPSAHAHLLRVDRIGHLLQGVCIVGVVSVFLGLLVPVVAAIGFPLALLGTKNLKD